MTFLFSINVDNIIFLYSITTSTNNSGLFKLLFLMVIMVIILFFFTLTKTTIIPTDLLLFLYNQIINTVKYIKMSDD